MKRFTRVALAAVALWAVPRAAAAQQPDLVVTSFTATVNDRAVLFEAQICNNGATDAIPSHWRVSGISPSSGMARSVVNTGVRDSSGTVRLSGDRRTASINARLAATLIAVELNPGSQ